MAREELQTNIASCMGRGFGSHFYEHSQDLGENGQPFENYDADLRGDDVN
jgi:hypothetical protein